MTLSQDDLDAVNALIVRGQLDAARCVERLLMDDETVLTVFVARSGVRIEIATPRRASPLWRDAATSHLTNTYVMLVASRFGCQVRWTISRAEHELMRIAGRAK